MKKTFNSSEERQVGYASAYVINSNSPDYLVGRLLTIVETLGLPERQEKSVKDLVRQEVYGSLNLATWIPSSLHNIIVDMYEWYQIESPRLKDKGPKGAPVSRGQGPVDHTMQGEYELSYQEK